MVVGSVFHRYQKMAETGDKPRILGGRPVLQRYSKSPNQHPVNCGRPFIVPMKTAKPLPESQVCNRKLAGENYFLEENSNAKIMSLNT